ncbi:MAG: Stp1/IreP family PP2C-type Ser/Thr phosphatase [Solirubrobacterales bacterium]|nr:Stp1/IreP family PP2C-type Ser/Thr phosphatase [Solirubrobacterales bacterium]MBV9716518.1 Stp1/IreP family PP2C-type Ser/Thr phosphatase [Solirubrobacterales bacterium]
MLRAAETTCKTDTGRQRRDNEDSALARAPVFVVADGMGGAQAGEVASRIAIEAFEHGLPDSGSEEERLAERVREANRQIHERSRSDHERAGMGTTLTAAYLGDGSLAIAHVGDSRAYMLRDGVLRRLTQDHSLVDELVRRGKLTEEQAAEHPQRSIITRALGPEPEVEVDTWSYRTQAGDVLLLCSDGLTSMVSEDRVAEILLAADTLDRAADQLIAEANEAGGRDNITVVLFRVEDVGRDRPADEQTTMAVAPGARAAADAGGAKRAGSTVALAPVPTRVPARPPLARAQGRSTAAPAGRRPPRYAKPLAAIVAVAVVLFLIGGGGYLASRQLYFIGTNSQGIVTIYRGLPYDLPAGIRLYETYYVSGVPAALVPHDRRSAVFNNNLRSEASATSLVHALELGELSR